MAISAYTCQRPLSALVAFNRTTIGGQMRCNAASEDELREQLPYSNVSLHVCADPAPAVYLTQVAINQQWADMKFPNRSLKKIVKPTVVAAFEASKQTHRNNAAQRQEAALPSMS